MNKKNQRPDQDRLITIMIMVLSQFCKMLPFGQTGWRGFSVLFLLIACENTTISKHKSLIKKWWDSHLSLNYSMAALHTVSMGSTESYRSIDRGQRWKASEAYCI